MDGERWQVAAHGLEPTPDDLDEARRQVRLAHLNGADQETLRRRLLDFCDVHPDALHRRCAAGHLTGSGVVVDPATGRSLLIHHAKLGRWLQPGGHADGDANLGAVAWREATEETGLVGLRLVTPAIDLDIHPIPARVDEPPHLHFDVRFLLLVGPSTRAVPNHETLGARWFGPDDPVVAPGGELARLVRRALGVASSLER